MNEDAEAGDHIPSSIVRALIAGYDERLRDARKDVLEEAIEEIVDEEDVDLQSLVSAIRHNIRTLIDHPKEPKP